MLAVLVERRRADRAQLAAREQRLHHVAGVDGAFRRARADDRVQLVDEEDDLPLGAADLVQHRLQPLLELAPVFRAGEERADVERPHALALQPFGDVSGDDPLRQPLDDRRLADAGVADQHRVVLRAPRQDLDHAPDLLVASDHRVELAVLRGFRQVAPELLQRLVRALGVLRRDALVPAHLLDPRERLVARDDAEREEQVLGRGEVVLELRALAVGLVEDASERCRDARLLLAALHRGPRGELLLRLRAQARPVGEQRLVEQREQQVLGVELRVAPAARVLLRGGDRLLCLDRQLLEVH